MILPFITQHLDSLQLWQFWHKHHLKPGLPEKGLSKTLLTVCFFTYNYSPLFTLNKKISNTVR
ncbi:hypothetical protein GVI70_10220 [Enterobacter hormaechei]|nr:hypothetical protein [Enterobacter hormaechei]QPO58756.1 hypothetical protein GVI74_16090 [Enterobacter hormaechei]QPO63955.1 hypothetical protein GVI72_19445 [Enterobacter hormaechei]QPO67830.1 hypothetical protein GVI67_16085 [Enterobacter hormaechei]RSA03719.1 hypothetical protein EGK20_13665 [Enterobacter hormaechei]